MGLGKRRRKRPAWIPIIVERVGRGMHVVYPHGARLRLLVAVTDDGAVVFPPDEEGRPALAPGGLGEVVQQLRRAIRRETRGSGVT